jgi:hypothetical protein
MANRIWHHMFGKGIVATVDNFGKMGEAPLNQELLDYLAVRFMDKGWSVKKLIREIALSRAYRMSTAHNVKNSNIDPYNDYLWRMNRRRLEVEAIRDSMMLISGKLELSRPEASPVLYFKRGFDVGRGQGTIPDDYAVKMAYRSVYVPVIRNFLPSMFETFDFPEPSEMKGRREITTIPTQALFLVNSPFVMDLSKSASERLLSGSDASGRQRVERVYREVLSRAATEAEIEQSLSFIDAMRSNTSGDNDEKSAWARLYQALFASAEFAIVVRTNQMLQPPHRNADLFKQECASRTHRVSSATSSRKRGRITTSAYASVINTRAANLKATTSISARDRLARPMPAPFSNPCLPAPPSGVESIRHILVKRSFGLAASKESGSPMLCCSVLSSRPLRRSGMVFGSRSDKCCCTIF